MAKFHFLSAGILAAEAKAIELAGVESVDHFQRHEAGVVGTIMLSVAGLEGVINETFANANEFPVALDNLRPEIVSRLGAAWRGEQPKVARMPLLAKYQLALVLADAPPLDLHSAVCREALDVARLRNTLVHYIPKWIEDDAESLSQRQDFEPRLTRRFQYAPALALHLGFPQVVLTYAWRTGLSTLAVDS